MSVNLADVHKQICNLLVRLNFFHDEDLHKSKIKFYDLAVTGYDFEPTNYKIVELGKLIEKFEGDIENNETDIDVDYVSETIDIATLYINSLSN